ncbi:MAG: FmdE family protein [Methermicoccaceae archaeon]
MEEVMKKITDPSLVSQIEQVVPFHGYLSTGAFIGIQMFNIAKKVLDIGDGERIYAMCETYNCLPDPFQILGKATTGNKGLRIRDLGKMAVVVNKRAPEGVSRVRGVRIVLDPAKTASHPRLHAWYMNTEKVPHVEAVSELIDAGESVYTYEMVDVEVPEKPRKHIVLCEACGESFIQKEGEVLCGACSTTLG